MKRNRFDKINWYHFVVTIVAIGGAIIVGSLFGVLGIVLLFQRPGYPTSIKIFSFSFQSENLAIASLFLATVMIIIVITIALRQYLKIINHNPPRRMHDTTDKKYNKQIFENMDKFLNEIMDRGYKKNGKDGKLC